MWGMGVGLCHLGVIATGMVIMAISIGVIVALVMVVSFSLLFNV